MSMLLPKHRPYRSTGADFQIGLKPLDVAEWLDIGSDHMAFMRAKRDRLRDKPALFYRAMPGSQPAQQELLSTTVANLLAYHSAVFKKTEGCLEDTVDGSRHHLEKEGADPLEILGNIVEEDFVLFERHGAADIMVAASNAYTSSGRIVSCVGHDMHFAHDPVPGLNMQLAPRIDRVMANVKSAAPVVRFNWFITPISHRLFPQGWHHASQHAAQSVGEELARNHTEAGNALWLRVERQTFLRLPCTGALAFGIHTYSDPLFTIADDKESLEAINRLVKSYSEDRLRYSGLWHFKEPLLRWIGDKLALL